ncbi:flagellar biosynthesis protein FlhF [Peribacillus sp. SCS-155]|uniref:flagellar biosynthesis protein FlhF n=1 Tax=Peribacillus sedimenti TaxID=3115297 RepID=UPI003905BFE6
MKVKKYAASSMTEAMKQIRAELGNEAVILSSKPIFSGGFLGFFRKRSIEVVAAVDPQSASGPVPVRKEKQRRQPAAMAQTKNETVRVNADDNANQAAQISKDDQAGKSSEDILKQIADVKDMIKGLNANAGIQTTYPAPLQEIYKLLVTQEFEPQLVQEMMANLLEKWFADKGQPADSTLREWLKDEIAAILTRSSIQETKFEKKYVSFVGPTGVGKTTTLAKIAADSMLKQHKKVAFITTDTYRIAAIDQLQTYAKILNVPIEVAYNLEDFKKAADRFAHYDLVFIDTAGRNFRDQKYVAELQKIIDFDKDLETYLVLSLTSKQKDMNEIYSQFSGVRIKQLIFTKADETSTYGAIVNLINSYKIGAAFITDGQNVPDDLKQIEPRIIANMIVEGLQ